MDDHELAAFQSCLGNEILSREAKDHVDISDLNIPLLRKFFTCGWSWGEASRHTLIITLRKEIRALEEEILDCPAEHYHTKE